MMKFLHIFSIILIHFTAINAFNLDVNNYIQHEGQPDTMFGFSVALHQEEQRSWVIIGAPTADRSDKQDGVHKGGAVFKCDIQEDNRCNVIPFDTKGNNYNDKNEQIDTKSNQWFGATVASAGINGPLVACAPRYVYHTLQPRKVERNEPVGTCFIARNNFKEFNEYSPCRTMYWGYHRQGSCQAGFSAALSKAGDRVFVGAPGSYYWQGQVFSINSDAEFPFKPPRYGQFGEGGQVYSTSLNNPKDRVYSTGESTAQEDDSYLGYSSATGLFSGSKMQDVAVGMPRGGGLLGKVLLFSWNMTNLQNITGEQIGAYFGYSIAVVDVDGDKLEDLLIGAPMYTEPNNEGKYETGRVYIMYQSKDHKFVELDTRDGVNSRGRFGLSLCSLGDINLDGYGDFAVGAPYDGPNNKGAVYIYHGSKTGPLEKASQVIFAEDIGGQRISTFGFSLSGGIDLDGNMYPDLVVGAYEADKALVFKARPVAVMEASTEFESETKLISLEERNCKLRDGKDVSCIGVNSCLKYNGINLPPTIDIEISWILDAKKQKNPRMMFVSDEKKHIKNSTMRLYRGKQDCRRDQVYLIENVRDKITSLEVEMQYNLRTLYAGQGRRKRAPLEPILDQNRGTVQKDSINIQKNCGSDNVCIPDLKLEVQTVDKYLLGSQDKLIINVLISNLGEDAFEAGYYMNIPIGLNYKNIERIGDIKDTPITCTPLKGSLKCDIGNPLSANKVVNFRVIFDPSKKAGMAPSYEFYMEANSTNAENISASSDNIYRKNIGIWIETDLSIDGNSLPPEFYFNATQYSEIDNATQEHELGEQIVHTYRIRNNGPSIIDEVEVYILWPYETLEGNPMLYLLEQPETSGNIKCDLTSHANIRDLLLDTKLSRTSYIEKVYGVTVKKDEFYNARFHGSKQSGASSSGSTSFSSSSSSSSMAKESGKVLTHEDRKRLDEEENLESPGDSLDIHRHRVGGQSSSQSGGYSRTSETRGQGGQGGYTRTETTHYSSGSGGSGGSGGGGYVTRTETHYGGRGGSQSGGQGANLRVTESRTSSSGSSSSKDDENLRKYGTFYDSGSSSQSSNTGGGYSRNQESSSGSVNSLGTGGGYSRTQESSSGSVNSQGAAGTGGGYSRTQESSSGSVNSQGATVGTGGGYSRTHESGTINSQGAASGSTGGGYTRTQQSSSGSINSQGAAVGTGGGYSRSYDSNSGSGRNDNTGVTGTTTSSLSGNPGRASYDANATLSGSRGAGTGDSRSTAYEHRTSWNSSSVNSGPVVTYTSSRNKTTYTGPDGRVRVIETSTEHYGGRQTGGLAVGGSADSHLVHKEDFSDIYRQNENRGYAAREGSSSSSSVSSSSLGRVSGGYDAAAQSGANSISRQSSSSSSSSSSGSQGSKSDITDLHVDQDISNLLSRTQTDSSSSGSYHSGRRRMMSRQDGEEGSEFIVAATGLEKAAQGTGSFHVGTLDLGVLSRSNVDSDVRRTGSAQISGGSSSYGQTSGGGRVSGGSAGGSSYSSHSESSMSGGGSRNMASGQQGAGNYGTEISGSRTSTSSTGGGNLSGGSSYSSHSESSMSGGGSRHIAGGQVGGSYGSEVSGSRSSSTGGAHLSGGSEMSGSRSSTSSSSYSSNNQNFSQQYGGTGGTGGSYSSYSSYSKGGGGNNANSGYTQPDYEENGDYEPEYEDEEDGDEYPSHHDIHDSKTGHSMKHINEGHENVDQKFKYYKKFRRSVDEVDELEDALRCVVTRCAILRCVTGQLLGNDEEAYIALRSRIVAKTFYKLSSTAPIMFSTKAIAKVKKLPFIGEPKEAIIKSHEIFVTATPSPEPKPDVIPLWVVVLAAVAGTIILILLVYLLYKCGFFKRNRPSDSSERQPLNRNGNYHGDEHL